MDIEKVFKLMDAGFTADEIRTMLNSSPAQPAVSASLEPLSLEPTGAAITKTEEAAPAEAPVEEPPAEDKPDPIAALKADIGEQINAAMKQQQESINKLAKLMGMPSMDNVQPKGIDDIVRNFFKEE